MSSRPVIHWCWPEILVERPDLNQRLLAVGELRVSEQLPPAGADVQFLVPRLSHEVDADAVASWPALKLVATPTTGTDHIDVAALGCREIGMISLKHDQAFLESLQATAELAWLLILACARRFREAVMQPLDGHWAAMDVRGNELAGKTLGIVGLGRLGSMVARFAQAFRMRVIACDVRPIEMDGVRLVTLDDLLAQSDVISLHVHLTDETRNLVGAREFGLMRRGAIFVNTSRGGLVDEAALLDALQSHHLVAAGLDVLDGERDLAAHPHPLIEFAKRDPRLIITPHVGGCAVEAQHKAFGRIIERLAEYIATRNAQ